MPSCATFTTVRRGGEFRRASLRRVPSAPPLTHFFPFVRAARNACGWIKKFGVLRDLLDECETRGEFERSAALAAWHGDLGECVAALRRGASRRSTFRFNLEYPIGAATVDARPTRRR